MAPWKGERKDSWASNPNIAVYIFVVLFTVWLGFEIWARVPGGPEAPTELGPMVMAALGVAITVKSSERAQFDNKAQRDVDRVTEVVKKEHPSRDRELGGDGDEHHSG